MRCRRVSLIIHQRYRALTELLVELILMTGFKIEEAIGMRYELGSKIDNLMDEGQQHE